MATGTRNAKSQKLQTRAPHEVIEEMEALKEPGESTAQFIVTSLQGEIKRRQRRRKSETPAE